MMDIKQLTTFLTLCRTNNFTRTAELLGYAQSSITAQIKQLESEMNVKLFDRIGKSVCLTSAGKALMPYATQIVSITSNLKDALSATDSVSGSITIGAAESICIYRLPKMIQLYRKLYPNVDIYLKLLNSDQVIPRLSDNSIDFAFTVGDKIETTSTVSAIQMPEQIVILASPEHPLASKAAVLPGDFLNEPFILTESGCNYRRSFEQDLRSFGVQVKVILETGSIQAIKEMAACGLGLCVLPRMAVTKELETRRLVELPYETHYGICSQLIYHKCKWLSPVLAEFIGVVKNMWPQIV